MASTYGCGVTAARPHGQLKIPGFPDYWVRCGRRLYTTMRSLRARPPPCLQDCNGQTINATLEDTNPRTHTQHLHRCGFPERPAAVRSAADVHPHGAASPGRFAGSVVRCDGLFPVDAARRLCLRPCADNLAAS